MRATAVFAPHASALLFALAFVLPAAAQAPGKVKDLPKLEEASKAADAAAAAAEAAARGLYDQLEQAVLAARNEGGATWSAELARVLEPLAAALGKEAAGKKGAAKTAAVASVLKREAATALGKLEIPALKQLAPYLNAQLTTTAADSPLTPAALEPKAFASAVLADLMAPKGFHEVWNGALVGVLPEIDAYRKGRAAAVEARWDLDVAKDPLMAFRRGAPEGFARVPAGAYQRHAALGQGARNPKTKQAITLQNDVFIGLYEVTHGDYYAWWKTLDAVGQQAHLPLGGADRRTPIWPVAEGAAAPAPTPEQLNLPVAGIKLPSALAYAASKGARLPTEAEWCAAAGGKDGLKFPWGAEWKPGFANDAEAGLNAPTAVGSSPLGRGPFGHLDLAGNVEEWTLTYESGKEADPTRLDSELSMIVRGGSYACSKDDVSNHWLWLRRSTFEATPATGFRLAIDAPPAPKKK